MCCSGVLSGVFLLGCGFACVVLACVVLSCVVLDCGALQCVVSALCFFCVVMRWVS